MKRILFSDPHIESKTLEELEDIFKEILSYEADQLIMLGDWYHHLTPSTKEIYFGTKWASRMKAHFPHIVFLRGNHGNDREFNASDHLQFLDIKVIDYYIDCDGNYYGHHFVYESNYNFGEAKLGRKELNKYNNVFLGHQHNPQKEIGHIGSCRYVHFSEVNDKEKYLVLLENNRPTFKKIESVIPMIDVYDIKTLKELDPNSKIRFVYQDFKHFLNTVKEVAEYQHNFPEFTTKWNFENSTSKIENSQKTTEKDIKQSILKWCREEVKDEDVKKLIIKNIRNES